MVVPADRSRILAASIAVVAVMAFALAAVYVSSDADGKPVQCYAVISDAESDDDTSGGSSIEHAEAIALFIAGAGTVLAVMTLIKNRGREGR